jgi:hypothetical protein
MSVKIRTQCDYLLTEATIEIPRDREERKQTLSQVDELMRESGGTGKVVAMYNKGWLLGINVEQKAKIQEGIADEVRAAVGVESKEFNGEDE